MSAKHTLGPWRVTEDDGLMIRSAPLPIYHAGRIVARVVRATDGNANAHLIAASPLLVEALRPLAKIAELVDDGARKMPDETGIWTRQSTDPEREFTLTLGDCRAARAAIAAAERK